MSLRAMLWALYDAPTNDLPAGAFRVLLVLADHASDDGSAAFPSRGSIAQRLAMSTRTVQRHLSALRGDHLIREGDQQLVDHIRPDRRPTVYNLAIWVRGDNPDPPHGETPGVSPTPHGETNRDRTGRQNRPNGETPGVSHNRPKPPRTTRTRPSTPPALCPRCNTDHDQTTTACPPMGPPPRPMAELVAEFGQTP